MSELHLFTAGGYVPDGYELVVRGDVRVGDLLLTYDPNREAAWGWVVIDESTADDKKVQDMYAVARRKKMSQQEFYDKVIELTREIEHVAYNIRQETARDMLYENVDHRRFLEALETINTELIEL